MTNQTAMPELKSDDYTIADLELAKLIMSDCGIASSTPSLEPGADPFAERIAKRIYAHRAAIQALSQQTMQTGAITLLKRLKRDLEHARRFSPDTLHTYRHACVSAEGDIEEFLAELKDRQTPPAQAQQPIGMDAQDMSTQYTYQENMYKKCEKLNTFDAQAPEERDKATCQVDRLHAHFTPFFLLANARRIASAEYRRKPNWVLAMNLFAVGSNSAIAICRDAEIDPDAIEVRRAAKEKANG